MYKSVLLIMLIIQSSFCNAQKEDWEWVMGHKASLKFCNSDCVALPIIKNSSFFNIPNVSNNSSICDSLGNLLFHCNGSVIFNKNLKIMEGGDSLQCGQYGWQYYPTDIPGFQGSLILPFPNHSNLYYVLYANLEYAEHGSLVPDKLHYSLVDITANNGLGRVINKDIVLLNSKLEQGRIIGIKHANGRDWWITVAGDNDKRHYIYLLNPTGIHLINQQTIGSPFLKTIYGHTSVAVNKSGYQLAYLYLTLDADHTNRIDIYHFDRCSGLLSNYQTINLIDSDYVLGCEFSPNDSLLYVSSWKKIYQYNLKNSMDSLKIIVGKWDSTNTTSGWTPRFNMLKIAPDNKIYVTPYGSSNALHCITEPNVRGIGCNFQNNYLKVDSPSIRWFHGAMPNIPNFRLGVLKGSPCDTIREHPPTPPVSDELLLYPNPTKELLVISYKLLGNAKIQLYDVLGRSQNQQIIKSSNQQIILDVSNLAAGLYIVRVKNSEGVSSKAKFIKQ
jgi:hypothetical protein